MNQISLVIKTFETYPTLILAFIVIVVMIGGAMYRWLLQPKLKRIEDIANNNTGNIMDIKDDLNVKHYELKADIKDLVHAQGENMKTIMTTLVDGITIQIKRMNDHNDNQHGELFSKIDEIGNAHHEIDKRLTLLEKK